MKRADQVDLLFVIDCFYVNWKTKVVSTLDEINKLYAEYARWFCGEPGGLLGVFLFTASGLVRKNNHLFNRYMARVTFVLMGADDHAACLGDAKEARGMWPMRAALQFIHPFTVKRS